MRTNNFQVYYKTNWNPISNSVLTHYAYNAPLLLRTTSIWNSPKFTHHYCHFGRNKFGKLLCLKVFKNFKHSVIVMLFLESTCTLLLITHFGVEFSYLKNNFLICVTYNNSNKETNEQTELRQKNSMWWGLPTHLVNTKFRLN